MADLPDQSPAEKLFAPEGTGTEPSADGPTIQPGDDLSNDAKQTLGDYLSRTTTQNEYNILGSGPNIEPMPGGDVEWWPLPREFANCFSEDLLEQAQSQLDLNSGGSTPDADGGGFFGDITDVYDKGAGSSTYTGNTLLNAGVGEGSGPHSAPSGEIPTLTSEVLKNNRFNPGGESPYIDDGGYSHGIWRTQKQLGKYDASGTGVSLEDLSQVGLSLMLRATDKGAKTPKDASKGASITGGIGLALQLERITDLGYLSANRVAEDIPNLSALVGSPNNFPALQGKNANSHFWPGNGNNIETDDPGMMTKSYGVLNSHMETFDGPLPLSMIVLAVLAAIATLVAGLVIAALILLIDLIASIGNTTADGSPDNPWSFGSSDPSAPDYGKDNWSKMVKGMMGVPVLRSGKNVFICMIFGVLKFFVPRVFGVSAGYYVVCSRNAVRDLDQIVDAFKSFPSDPLGIIEGIFILIEAFVTSATYKFCVTMAKLGDIVVMAGGLFGKGETGWIAMGPGDMSSAPPTLSNLHRKSRLLMDGENNSGHLAMGLNNLPSLFLIPGHLDAAVSKFGKSSFNALQNGEAITTIPGEDGLPRWGSDAAGLNKEAAFPVMGRFTTDDVRKYEAALDTQYMPFYFQDLRTNELLAFHAFVEGISDSFSPKWTATSGFGRMDPVQTYESTSRNIGITFHIISTSPEDFSDMYLQINRLVNLVYPSWSAGMKRKDVMNNSFMQPFSQVPTASPVIRMRLGDLFKSNYSKVGMTRLFGAGTEAIHFEPIEGDPPTDVDPSEIAAKLAETKLRTRYMHNHIDPMAAQLINAAIIAGPLAVAAAIGGVSPPKGYYPGDKISAQLGADAAAGFKVAKGGNGVFKKKLKRYPAKTCKGEIIGYIVKPMLNMSDDKKKKSGRKRKAQSVLYVIKPDETLEPDATKFLAGCKGVGFIVPVGELWMDWDATTIKIKTELANPPAPIPNPFAPPPDPLINAQAEEVAFFDSENNAVIRSFESAGGQGIAGVITNLDFDWNDKTWEINIGSRGPQSVKVTMGFAPIHDIPMGLDHGGAMRAPAYPVGESVKQYFGANGPYDLTSEEDMVKRAAMQNMENAWASAAAEVDGTNAEEEDPDQGELE